MNRRRISALVITVALLSTGILSLHMAMASIHVDRHSTTTASFKVSRTDMTVNGTERHHVSDINYYNGTLTWTEERDDWRWIMMFPGIAGLMSVSVVFMLGYDPMRMVWRY